MSNLYNTLYPYILTSTCLIGAYLAYKYRFRIIRLGMYASMIFACSAFVWAITREPEVRIESKIIEVRKGKENLNDLLSEIPSAYGVPESIARAIVEQESGGKMESIRFEPGQMTRAGKFTKNTEQQKMLASSHCAMQVMGYHAPGLGLTWTDLYDPRTCVETGMKILADCMHRAKDKGKYDKYFSALACYNGSEKYAHAVLGAVARQLIEEKL
jgi:soluble lytic murein transglycosylase-like protein